MMVICNPQPADSAKATRPLFSNFKLGCFLILLLCWVSYIGRFTTLIATEPPAAGSSGGRSAAAAAAAPIPAAVAAAAAAALSGASATLHGPAVKGGHVDELRWHPRHAPDLRYSFSNWVDRRRQHGEGKGYLSPEVWPGCAVWGSHAYRVLFVRHPKCATSSILHHFTVCGMPGATKSCLEMWSGGTRSPMANFTSADVQRMWRDYFVFTVVRNPLARAVSSYKFVLSATLASKQCRDKMDWDRFCDDPVVAADVCRTKHQCCAFGGLFSFAHIIDQARCMQTADGGLAVDYVARVENLDEDMAEVYAEINRRRPPSLPALEVPAAIPRMNSAALCKGTGQPTRRHRQTYPTEFFGKTYNFSTQLARESAYCSMDQFYRDSHAHCLQAISRVYGRDLALLYPGSLQQEQEEAQQQEGGAQEEEAVGGNDRGRLQLAAGFAGGQGLSAALASAEQPD